MSAYTRADLTKEEAGELELRYREWKERYGGLPEREERLICKVLQCTPLQLEEMSILRLIAAEERLNAGRPWMASAGTYLERWACRWLKEREV